MLPKSSDFNFRTLFDSINDAYRKYLGDDLVNFVSNITTTDTSFHRKNTSEMYSSEKKMKAMTVCAILSNIMDPRCTCLQTLGGLLCYSQGLRDKGMKILNACGVTCSMFHIRQHGSLWARLHKAIREISPSAFWRVTLDFKMKFAKKIDSGVGQLKRMLHLLTS